MSSCHWNRPDSVLCRVSPDPLQEYCIDEYPRYIQSIPWFNLFSPLYWQQSDMEEEIPTQHYCDRTPNLGWVISCSWEPYATPEACLGTGLQWCARLSRLASCSPGCNSPNSNFFRLMSSPPQWKWKAANILIQRASDNTDGMSWGQFAALYEVA